MTELLINWLNNEIVLSKPITDLSIDFHNGYLFAELLYKTRQIPNLSLYKNTSNYKDIIFNFCHLQKSFMDMGIILDEKSRNEIINSGPYTSKIYLYKIKQVLSKKYIDLEQLKIKESNTLQNLYNKMCFKNDNEKYLYDLQKRLGKDRTLKKNNSAYLPVHGKSIENLLNDKYTKNGVIYNEIKEKFGHLDFTENDIKMIMEDMKQNENKLLYLKEMVSNTENKRKKYFNEKDEEVKKRWQKSMVNMENFKMRKIKESWDTTIKYKLAVKNYFRRNAKNMAKESDNFDNNLKLLVDETGKSDKKESTEIIMLKMREKLNEKIKNKKDKEKRERKRLKEEQEMNYRIFSEKNMNDMVKSIENNLKKNNNENKEPIKIKEDLITIKEKDRLDTINENEDIKEINKIKNNLKGNKSKVSTGKSRNKSKTNTIESNENEKKEVEISEKEKMGLTATSSYSKLTINDYGLGLINECLSIHNFNIKVNDRIQLFKTLILPINNDELEKKYKNLPKFDIYSSSTNHSLIKNFSTSNIYNNSLTLNNSSKFDKQSYLEEIDKLDYELFIKELERKKNRFKKRQNLMEPILNKIIDVAEFVERYQDKKKVDLIDNSKWDEIMLKFKNNEIIDDDEDNKSNIKDECDSQYLFDYADKLTYEDEQKIFDYINYIDLFNDLIIPNEQRGKKFIYQDLYKDFYIKQNNHGIDIKEYEPNEEENENLLLPKNGNIKNFKISDIIENMIENKYKNQNIKNGLNNDNNGNNIYEQKGKYYFIPIKIVLSGYPLSGKKTQSLLINEKYPGIKIYDPFKLLEDKVKEYKTIKEMPEKNTSAKGKHKNKNEESKKEKEEKLKEFEPILNIINPYLEYLDKLNKLKEKENKEKEKEKEKEHDKKKGKKKKKNKNDEEEKKNDTINDNKTQDNLTQDDNTNSNSNTTRINIIENYNEKEKLLSDIYLKLIIYQLEKDFPDDKDSKNNFVEKLKEKYNEYLNLREKIEEIKNKIASEESIEKEAKEVKGQKQKKQSQLLHNLNKELENTTKIYNTTTNSLYVGFIIINFPKTLKEAEKLEKYFTGYISEFEKENDEGEKKLYSYENIIDINVKQKSKKNGEYSMLDLFIELNISSNEVDRRYEGARYDPTNGNIYHMDDNPPPKEDKKKEKNLLPGVPNLTKEEFGVEKLNYEKNIKNLERLYKAMENGYDKVYKNLDQMDVSFIHNINNSLESNISEIIFNNYYNNIDNILTHINKNINNNNLYSTIENSSPNILNINNNNIESKDKNKEDSLSTIQQQVKDVNSIEISNNADNNTNNTNNNIFEEEIISDLDTFNLYYKSNIRNFIHFIIRQKEHIINYLSSIQNIFVNYLNRKTEKTEIAEIYINKYNSLLENYPEFKNNPTVYNELSENIKDVNKSIWVNIQNKKNNDVKYLQEIKNSEKRYNEINQFWEYIILLFESEVQKYLKISEVIIKYYLSLTGLLNNIYGIFENNYKINKTNDYLFKIDYKKYLFEEIDLPPYFIAKNNNINKEINNNMSSSNDKIEHDTLIPEVENEAENERNNDNDNTLTRNNSNKAKDHRNSKKEEKTFDEKIDILFMNSLKIIIRQDKVFKKYLDKIKSYTKKNEKDFRSSVKMANNSSSLSIEGTKKNFNSTISSRSTHKKKFNKKSKANELIDNILYEEIMNQIIKEKRKFKYRLMFLKYYAIRYNEIINECYNETYNTMDDLIIMSVRSQNNTLNEFINYLKRTLNNFNHRISLDNFEFDSYDIYRRYKIDVSNLYEKMKFNAVFNVDKIKIGEHIEDENAKINENKIFISEEEMSYIQLYVYNLNDLMYIYNYIKTYGAETCNFLVKYDIVKEILIHQYFTKKKYGIYSKNDNDDNINIHVHQSSSSNLNLLTYNPVNKFNILNNNDVLGQMLAEENNGICKKIIFSSNVNFSKFLKKFSVYNSKYININELFTCLLILGSNLITSYKFMELIKEYIPEDKKNAKNILLTKEEFMKIPMWFEKDDYLNILIDSKEQELYYDITKYYYSEEEIEDNNNEDKKPLKINAIKEAIFEINSEDNLIDINKISNLLNKINKKIKENQIYDEKLTSDIDNNINIIDENNLESNNNNNEKGDMDFGNSSLNEELNKFEINLSKGKETDSKATLTLQSELDLKKRKKYSGHKENINNIFNALFIS